MLNEIPTHLSIRMNIVLQPLLMSFASLPGKDGR